MTELSAIIQVSTIYDLILLLAVMILLGMFVGRLAERHNIPNITGYLVLGIVAGIILVLLGVTDLIEIFIFLTTFCLGFIAFSIGLELDFKKLKSRRNEVIIVTLTQATMTFLFTAIGLYIFRLKLPLALLLGAIAIATEPGPILQMTKRYKTKGELTDTLVPLHGVEDAFAILIFGVVLSYAYAVDQGISMTFMMILEGPIFELVFSILFAVIIGGIFRAIIHKLDYYDRDKDLVVFVTAVVAILISISLANRGVNLFGFNIHLSPILLPMGVGITFANMSSKLAKHETEHMLDQFAPPIMIAFFTVVGAEMVFLIHGETAGVTWQKLLLYGAVYIIFRIFGKLFGSYCGGFIAKSHKNVRKYLGFCLLPQAQAAIGLAFYARSKLSDPAQGNLLILVVIVGTMIYELLGPFGLRHSLIRCQEVDEHGMCIILPREDKK